MKRGVDIIHRMLGTDRKKVACTAWSAQPNPYKIHSGPTPYFWITTTGFYLVIDGQRIPL